MVRSCNGNGGVTVFLVRLDLKEFCCKFRLAAKERKNRSILSKISQWVILTKYFI
jgi:hypothetical protein